MPISPIVLQRRHAELGRIRLGDQQPTSNGKTRPNKLSAFRFTSVSERYIKDLAELYGGEARAWDNNGIPSWEVYTTAKSMPVIAVKGGLSQWMETWSGGGCTHRCDGETNVLTGETCDPQDRDHVNAKPTTRLSLMLPELEAIGVWRLESHGWNAAAEIPAVAELAQYVGDLVPAHLHLVERRSVKDGKTSRFVVPVLDLQIGTARLREIVAEKSGTAPELSGPAQERPALKAGSSSQAATAETAAAVGEVSIPTPDQIAAADVATLRKMADYLGQHGLAEHPARKAALARIDVLEDAEGDEDGVVDAEIVPDAAAVDADAVWQQILAAGGKQGLDLGQVTEDFSARMGGLIPDDASAAELSHYLGLLTNEQVPA